MDEIRSWLYIGKYRDTLDKNYLDFKSIKAMLQLADPVEQKGINSLFLVVEDMGETPHTLIRQGVDFILNEKEKGNKVLVACGAGINRSTAFCMAALKEVEGLSLLDTYQEIKRKHPDSLPNGPVWESFCTYYNETTSYIDVMRITAQYL
jgi:protein-tyrosine phosphatase